MSTKDHAKRLKRAAKAALKAIRQYQEHINQLAEDAKRIDTKERQ